MKRAFTLIELLVVVAIIGVLAGLLMPAFASARGKARSISCVSQLRQWGVAASLYFDDYNDALPFDSDTTGSSADNPSWQYIIAASSTSTWYNVLPHYVQQKSMAGSRSAPSPLYKSSNILQCPAAKWATIPNNILSTVPPFSYAFNSKIMNSSHPAVRRGELDQAALDAGGGNVNNRAVGPSAVAMMQDTWASTMELPPFSGANPAKVGSPHCYTTRLSDRHSKGVNIVFFDGSVRSFVTASLMDSAGKNLPTSPVIWNPWNPDEQ